MEDPSASTKDSNIEKGEEEEVFSVEINEEGETSPAHVSLDIPAEREHSRRQILHRVPPQVLENKKHIYDPVVLSLGPYHDHRQPQFRQTEELKDEVVNIICGAKDKGFLRSKIQERVDEIRHFYGGVSKDVYGDEALAEMMFRNACFVIYYIGAGFRDQGHIVRRLGMSGAAFMYRDFFMLENQIPLWLVKLLFSLTVDDNKDEGEAVLCEYLSLDAYGDYRLTRVPWEDKEEEPLHLLGAHHCTRIFEEEKISTSEPIKDHHYLSEKKIKKHRYRWIFQTRWGRRKSSNSSSFETANCQFRSVTDLKAKGIHFGPSSYRLTDIRFRSYLSYGKLQLPIWYVTNNSKVFFSNVIAFEMSPETDTDFPVTSYVDFMKSLIESPKDVKELREKGILFSRLANDEQVVRMFKEIDTYAAQNEDYFQDVKMRIDKHCSSKAKTWMAELTYTYFRSPWTAIALFAATFLLCLTFLQTYYTMNPTKNGDC